jgi:hypothetical protein
LRFPPKVDQGWAIMAMSERLGLEARLEIVDFPAPIEPALRKLQLGFWAMKVTLQEARLP